MTSMSTQPHDAPGAGHGFQGEQGEQDAAGRWKLRAVAEAWRQIRPVHQRVLGPATERLLDLAGVAAGGRVLDVAAGTGEQTVLAAQRVGPTGSVLATDISATMLEVAGDVFREAGLTNVETRVMDAQRLELEPDSFDAAISRNGLMLVPQPHLALAGMKRAVKPGSKVAALVWSAPERNPFITQSVGVLLRRGWLPAPRSGEPGMFALAAPGALEGAFRDAGLGGLAVEAVPIAWRFPAVADALHYFEVASASLKQELTVQPSEAEWAQAWEEVAQVLEPFRGAQGLAVPGEVLIGVGTK